MLEVLSDLMLKISSSNILAVMDCITPGLVYRVRGVSWCVGLLSTGVWCNGLHVPWG